MRISSLAVGDELLDGRAVDTHGPWLSERIVEHGCIHVEHRVLPDELDAIAGAIRGLAGDCDLLLVTGGLGPTSDDLTREALALASGTELVEDPGARRRLEERYSARGRVPGPGNLRQAMRPSDAACLENQQGTAPGILASLGATRVVLLPGPPHEMQPMYREHVLPMLDGEPRESSSVQSFGIAESDAAERLGELADRDRIPLVCFKVSDSVVRADVHGPGAATVSEAIRECWHPFAFGGGEDTLASVTLELLRSRGATVVVAESCTGGLLGGGLTSVPGSSSVFLGGFLTYSNHLKHHLLGIPEEVIERHGAVSRDVALMMAMESARRLGATFGLSTTGIAGPDGGSEEKPCGTVWIGLCDASGTQPRMSARRVRFPGSRDQVRDRTMKAALQLLRLHLLGEEATLLWEQS
ncbi:MAG: CinA family nicotinamide mononucleotide deamidase-related protein [Planctomycetota bacterium]|nr:CinA family nicotinamide mononucleotide deamidase-related protein [Planctomycetota bacterium]